MRRFTFDKATITSGFDSATYARGLGYFHAGRVRSLGFQDSGTLIALVAGSTLYSVTLSLATDSQGGMRLAGGVCDCPVGYRCKHMVAALLELARTLETASEEGAAGEAAIGWRGALSEIVAAGSPAKDPVGLLFEPQRLAPPRRYGAPAPTRPEPLIKLGVRPAVQSERTGKWVMTGVKWGSVRSYGAARQPGHDEWFHEWLALYQATERALGAEGYYEYGRHYRQAPAWCYLDDFASGQVWNLLAEARRIGIPFVRGANARGGIDFRAEPLQPSMEISEDPDGSLRLEARFEPHGGLAGWEVRTFGSPAVGSYRWPCGESPESSTIVLAPLAGPIPSRLAAAVAKGSVLRVPARERDQFFALAYPVVSTNFRVQAPASGITPRSASPRLLFALDGDGATRIDGRVHWLYEDSGELVAEIALDGEKISGGPVLKDTEGEARILALAGEALRQLKGKWPAGEFTLSGLDALAFSLEAIPAMESRPDDFSLHMGKGFPDFREADEPPSIRLATPPSASGRVDWLDLAVEIEVAGRKLPVAELLSVLHSGASRFLLEDGTHFSLRDPALERFWTLAEEARSLADAPPARIRLSRFQLDLAAELASVAHFDGEVGGWLSRAASLTGNQGVLMRDAPEELKATLRPYQAEGYSWLAFLRELELGGILADDMGLGKTVQALALLVNRHCVDQSERPSLIVAPTSVAANWISEAARFAPSLRVASLGTTARKERATVAERLAGVDVAITTYAVLRLDEDEFAGLDWDCVIFDEAQFVKNHQSKGYRAARKLAARAKFALTGTPLENNLMEFWSILSLVTPGLLGPAQSFKAMYQAPIENGRNPEALARLRRRTRPIMLRRTKDEVIAELPGKVEQVIELPLTPQHKRVYELHLQRERQRILGLLEDFRENRISIFSSLTKLRQLSIDPSLVDPQAYSGIASAKLDFLIESLEEITAEGHRALVFSQFTSFLGKIREILELRGMRHLYLDGGTRQRGKLLEEFATGEIPVFLISLKAGGFGLNLTAADYVYLVDPWWNPAAESQAVDRAHRIGQTRGVMIYRLVSQGTIEEKVVQLGKRKAELFAQVMQGVANDATAIGADDIRQLLQA